MSILEFKGFGGVRLEAEALGEANDPAILLVHGAGQTREVWADVSQALVRSGRRVIALDLRGHGKSEWPKNGSYDFDAHVEDLRAVLSQLATRPVVVAATLGGWIAVRALAQDASALAAGLVLVDVPSRGDGEVASSIGDALRRRAQAPDAQFDHRAIAELSTNEIAEQLIAAAPNVAVPTCFIRGGLSKLDSRESAASFASLLPDCETIEVEDADLLVVENRTEAFNALLLDFLERKQQRAASEFRAGSDARTLRDAMGCFATGVTVVTTNMPDGTPVGLTANSFSSVSLDPPLLLVCIANNAGTGKVLREAKNFGVNMLQTAQQPVSNRFAGKSEDRFSQTDWHEGETGVPVIDGSLGAFECRQHTLHEAGDHFILVGEVVRAQFEPRRDPLLYFRGKYRRLHFA